MDRLLQAGLPPVQFPAPRMAEAFEGDMEPCYLKLMLDGLGAMFIESLRAESREALLAGPAHPAIR